MLVVHHDARDEQDRQHIPRYRDIAHQSVVEDLSAIALRDDESGQRGGHTHGQRLHRGIQRHEGAAQFGLCRRRDDGHRRYHAPRHQHEKCRGADQPKPQRRGADMGDRKQRQQCRDRDHPVDPDLAALVGPMADLPRREQRCRTAREIDERDVMQRDADVAHRVNGDVGDHREARKDQQRGKQQRVQMIPFAQHLEHRREWMSPFLVADVIAQVGQDARADHDEQHGQGGDQDERRAPHEMIGEPEGKRYPGHRGKRECSRYDAACLGAA